MKKVVFGFFVFVFALIQLVFANKIYAASPGKFDCTVAIGPNCVLGHEACRPGTKSDPSYCERFEKDVEACKNATGIDCIPDPKSNTVGCVFAPGSGGCVAVLGSDDCQAGFMAPCSSFGATNCSGRKECVLEHPTNSSKCVWDPQRHGCAPDFLNNDCQNGYMPDCAGKDEAACKSEFISCVPEDELYSPGPTIPVYDPECTTDNGQEGVKSALGCLPTGPQAFVFRVLPWSVFLGAGIAFVLGILGSMMIVLSAGNPEKMQAGKEMITSAIGGLVLIVSAVFLLELIGVKILKLFTM